MTSPSQQIYTNFSIRKQILGTFKNRKKYLLAGPCLSIWQHVPAPLSLDIFQWNFISGAFIKFVKKIHVQLKSDKNYGTLYGNLSTFYIAGKSCNKIEHFEPNYILQ